MKRTRAPSTVEVVRAGDRGERGGVEAIAGERDLGAGEVTELGERARLDRDARADDAHPVAEVLDLGEDVARQQHGGAVAEQGRDLASEHRLHERVEARGGLVEDVEVGGRRERGDERDLLPVALRVGAALLRRVELEDLDEVLAARGVGVLVGRAAAQAREQVDGLAAREIRPEADIAGHVRDAPVQLDGVAPRVAAEDGRAAAARADEAEQHADGGGLPRAVRAEETVHLAGCDLEVESVECTYAAESLLEAACLDDGVHEGDDTPASQICEYS